MKKFFGWFLLTFAVSLAAKEPLSASLEYRMVTADQAEVTITVSGKGRPVFALPEVSGGRWLENQRSEGTSMQSNFVNGKGSTIYSFTSTLPLLLTQDDAVTIPPVIVTLDGARAQTEKVVIPARSERLRQTRNDDTGAVDLSTLSATLSFAGGARHFIGETVAFTLEITVPSPAQLAGIDFHADGGIAALIRDPSLRILQTPQRRGNSVIYRLGGTFRSTKSGEWSTEVPIQLSLQIPSARKSNMFDDFFFGGMRGTSVIREIVAQSKVKKIEIAPLPPLPEGAYDLGLSGAWKLAVKFTPEKNVKVGEAVTLTITGEGDRPATGMRAPKLSSDHFRIYPPEVRKKGNTFHLTYAMIPLTAGDAKVDFPFAVFDAVDGKYKIFHAKTQFVVAGGVAIAAAPRPSPEIPAGNAPAQAVQSFFYPRPAGKHFIALPLWKNIAVGAVSLIAAAAMIGATVFAWSKRRHFTPAWRRRSQKRYLHQLLKRADAKVLAAQLPCVIGELLQLPPGATTAEIAAKVDDAVVRDALTQCGQCDFMPGKAEWSPDRKTRALWWMHCKRLFLLFGLLLPWLTQAEHALFDAGRFAEAAKEYEAKYDPHHPDVDLLYNIGAAYFHAENFAAARLALKRAKLLAPRDREVTAHLAETEEKLGLPAADFFQASKGDRLLGVLRPDEWLFADVCIIALFLVFLGFFSLLSPAWRKWGSGGALVIAVFCFVAAGRVKDRLYFPGEAMVSKETALRTLPSMASGRMEASLRAGSDLRIWKTQGKWLLVETANARGWVVADDVEKLFPDGLW